MLGQSWSFLLRHNGVKPASDMSINPTGGRKFDFRYDYQKNKFIDGFKLNSNHGTFVETYIPYNYNQVTLKWEEYFRLPWSHTLTVKLNGGYIDRSVDSFFNFFAGGILGMKGYPYYSMEGRKLLSSSLVYRFKISDNLGFKLLPIKFDKLYAALFFDYGNAWDLGKPDWDLFKKDAGIQLRLETFSFYNFPTRFFFDAAYGLDDVFNRGQKYGNEWRFYFGVAFDYID
jgi:outer membrane translocation and assembly module TamA